MWTSQGASRWDFVADDKGKNALRLRVWLADRSAEQIFTATGIGYNIGQKAPTLIRRRNARSTRFVTVYDLSGRGDYVRQVVASDKAGAPLVVTTQDGNRKIVFTPQGVKTSQTK
jgi:hypothetical protein